MPTRRDFLQQSAGSLLASTLPFAATPALGNTEAPKPFLDLTRGPDGVSVRTASGDQQLRRTSGGRWEGTGVVVRLVDLPGAVRVELMASAIGVLRVGLRWNERLDRTRLLLGDAWERGYGDLEWRGFVPDRVMPWYVMAYDGDRTDGYGVRTGAAAFCFWQADPAGLSLWADVRSGGTAVSLGERTLTICDVICRAGRSGESSFAALRAFCRQMCAKPLLPTQPVYGSNDWYWAYGKNSAASALADAQRIVDLSPTDANRPIVVIDDGWQLSRDRKTLDPTVAAVREKIIADMARLRSWGMELIKHDYSSWDILGRWGYSMGSSLTKDGWTFAAWPRVSSFATSTMPLVSSTGWRHSCRLGST